MSLIIKNKKMALLAALLVLIAVVLLQGCGTSGKRECEAAPFGAVMTLKPGGQSVDTGGAGLGVNLPWDWTVIVLYPDGTPMPYACLNISGAFAVPNLGLYQFQYFPSWVSPNTPVNSGFRARTDVTGQYTFSTVLSAGSGTWKDTIYIRSGTVEGAADIEVK